MHPSWFCGPHHNQPCPTTTSSTTTTTEAPTTTTTAKPVTTTTQPLRPVVTPGFDHPTTTTTSVTVVPPPAQGPGSSGPLPHTGTALGGLSGAGLALAVGGTLLVRRFRGTRGLR